MATPACYKAVCPNAEGNAAVSTKSSSTGNDAKPAGYAIGVSTVLILVFVAHHPVATIHDRSDVLQSILQIETMDRLVHGGLIALMLAVLTGLICYLVGCIATIGAALLDGFIIPDLAERFVNGSPDDMHAAYGLVVYSGLAIQSLTKLGLILISVGILGWALALLSEQGFARGVGLVGIIAGAVPAALLLVGGMILVPRILLGLLLAQSLWNLCTAGLLLRRGRHFGSELVVA